MSAPLFSRRLANQTVAPRAERAIPDFRNWVRRECTKCPKDGSFCENCFGLRFTFRPPTLTTSERRERNWRWAGVAVLLGLLAAALILGGCQKPKAAPAPEPKLIKVDGTSVPHEVEYQEKKTKLACDEGLTLMYAMEMKGVYYFSGSYPFPEIMDVCVPTPMYDAWKKNLEAKRKAEKP